MNLCALKNWGNPVSHHKSVFPSSMITDIFASLCCCHIYSFTGCLPSSEEWGLLRVTSGGELGSLERVGEKMAYMSSTISLLDVRAMRAEQEAREAKKRETRAQQQFEMAHQLAEEARQQDRRQIDVAREREETLQQLTQKAQQQAEKAIREAEESQQQADQVLEREVQLQEKVHNAERRAQQLIQEAEQRENVALQREEVARQQSEEREARLQRQIHEARQQTEEALQQSQVARQQREDALQLSEEAQQQRQEALQQSEEARQQAEEEAREREERLQEKVCRAEQRAQLTEQRAAEEEPFWAVGWEEIELQEGEELGRGGWAVVMLAKFRGARVAAKCLHGVIASDYNRELFVREMNFASRIRHPNLVQFIGGTLYGELVILTELMLTSVRALMEERARDNLVLLPVEITSISLNVACALNYLHLIKPDPIIHRDISSANVLLEPAPGNCWRAKVSDYGSVNFLRQLRTIAPGNPAYAAPEAKTPSQQSAKMDIFSFGVLLLEMASCRFPDPSTRERHIGCVHQPGLVAVIRQCMLEDRGRRPSAGELLAQIELWHW